MRLLPSTNDIATAVRFLAKHIDLSTETNIRRMQTTAFAAGTAAAVLTTLAHVTRLDLTPTKSDRYSTLAGPAHVAAVAGGAASSVLLNRKQRRKKKENGDIETACSMLASGLAEGGILASATGFIGLLIVNDPATRAALTGLYLLGLTGNNVGVYSRDRQAVLSKLTAQEREALSNLTKQGGAAPFTQQRTA